MGAGPVKTSIKWKILSGIVVIEILLTVIFAGIVINTFQRNLRLNSIRTVENIQGMYDSIMRNDTKMLSAALEVFLQDDSFKEVYIKKNRDELQNAVEELYSHNRDRYGMTHFYYINNDGECFLRAHKPELFGDTVNRLTLLEAKRTKRISSGIELGQTAFALRVVSPCIYRGEQIGFVEFGEEIDHFDKIVKEETGSDVFVVVRKNLLREKNYRNARKNTGRRDDWDDLENYALVSETFGNNKFFTEKIFNENDVRLVRTPVFLGTISQGSQVLAKGAFPLHDASNKQVGIIMTLTDVTEMMENENMALTYLIVAAIALFLVSYGFTFIYLKKVIIAPLVRLSNMADEISMGKLDVKLETKRTDEIGMLISSFDRMRISVKKFLEMLAKREDKHQ